jgi:ribonuclease HI
MLAGDFNDAADDPSGTWLGEWAATHRAHDTMPAHLSSKHTWYSNDRTKSGRLDSILATAYTAERTYRHRITVPAPADTDHLLVLWRLWLPRKKYAPPEHQRRRTADGGSSVNPSLPPKTNTDARQTVLVAAAHAYNRFLPPAETPVRHGRVKFSDGTIALIAAKNTAAQTLRYPPPGATTAELDRLRTEHATLRTAVARAVRRERRRMWTDFALKLAQTSPHHAFRALRPPKSNVRLKPEDVFAHYSKVLANPPPPPIAGLPWEPHPPLPPADAAIRLRRQRHATSMADTPPRGVLTAYVDGSRLEGRSGSGVFFAGDTADLPSRTEIARRPPLVAGESEDNCRAELYAAVIAAETAPRDLALRIVQDARYVTDTVRNPMWLFTMANSDFSGQNGDLWARLAHALLEREARTYVTWVKAHTGGTDELSRGNERADMLAKEGTEQEPDEAPPRRSVTLLCPSHVPTAEEILKAAAGIQPRATGIDKVSAAVWRDAIRLLTDAERPEAAGEPGAQSGAGPRADRDACNTRRRPRDAPVTDVRTSYMNIERDTNTNINDTD